MVQLELLFLGKCLDQIEKWNGGSIARSKYQRESIDGMNPSIPRIGLAKSAGNPVNPDVSKKKTWFFRMASRQDIRFNIFNQSIEFVQDAAKAFPVVEICSSINAFAIGFAVQALNLSEF